MSEAAVKERIKQEIADKDIKNTFVTFIRECAFLCHRETSADCYFVVNSLYNYCKGIVNFTEDEETNINKELSRILKNPIYINNKQAGYSFLSLHNLIGYIKKILKREGYLVVEKKEKNFNWGEY